MIIDSIGMITTKDGEIKAPFLSWGIYLDNWSSGVTVIGNIVIRATTGGLNIHGGWNSHVENNIFVDGLERQIQFHPEDERMRNNRFVRNIIAYANPDADMIYLFQSWMENKPGRPSECDHNLYWLTGGDLLTAPGKVTPDGAFAEWQAKGFDIHSRVADPLFVNPSAEDYRLRPESPAWEMGFQPIKTEWIGPEGWALRGRPAIPARSGQPGMADLLQASCNSSIP